MGYKTVTQFKLFLSLPEFAFNKNMKAYWVLGTVLGTRDKKYRKHGPYARKS